ncbi:MAG: hypothetical protein D6824_06795 [Planctomycetota bacterium]|nr:MAG: hypothetical protein D6824_06795 [Planctomycetota bacterium]
MLLDPSRHGLRRPAAAANRRRPLRRRAVIGVLSMMFLVLFSSLALAMAVVSRGNLRTAEAHLRVVRALGSTDTGLAIAEERLRQAAATFRVEKGEITPDFAIDLWQGVFSPTDGQVLLPSGDPATFGVRDFLAALHANDQTIDIAPYFQPQNDWLVTAPIILDRASDDPADPLYNTVTSAAQITYIPLPDIGGVRAVVTGYDWDWTRSSWIERTAQRDFRIFKRVDQAILAPSKIMIGKNVQINGPLGARFTGVENVDGDPLVVRSDFLGLSPTLDQKIQDFYAAVHSDDVDGDNRLASEHAIESSSLAALNLKDYDGDGDPDAAFTDISGDGVVDEFDIFLQHFDADGDHRVVLSDALTAGTPAQGEAAEFAGVDEDLALLIDSAVPDRNGDGVVDAADTVLGYRDGRLDFRDQYAKVRGPVLFRVNRADWEASLDAQGDPLGNYQKRVEGAIRPGEDKAPVSFDQDDATLPQVSFDTFNSASSALAQDADGAPFAVQAGISGPLFTLVTNADGVVIGQSFNPAIPTVFEPMPFGALAPADWYERPVFQNITFKDVVIPMGLNALFVNCTFVGVTRVETYQDNTHPAWQFYGQQESSGALKYPPLPDDSPAQLDNDYYPPNDPLFIKPPDFDVPRLTVGGVPYVNTKPLSNNIRFHNCTFVGSIVADKPTVFTHIRNKLQFTGATKFYEQHPDSPNDPALNPEPGDLPDIEKSSMMLPQYSVDVGTNNAPADQDVNLQGVVIAGVLDVRGNTTINGALLLTFEPSLTDPALQHFGTPVGNPANFNVTLGYFSPDQGDQEGLSVFDYNGQKIVGFDTNGDGYPDSDDPASGGTPVPFNGYGRIVLNWDPNLVMPDGLIAPIAIEPVSESYVEGRLVAPAGGAGP